MLKKKKKKVTEKKMLEKSVKISQTKANRNPKENRPPIDQTRDFLLMLIFSLFSYIDFFHTATVFFFFFLLRVP